MIDGKHTRAVDIGFTKLFKNLIRGSERGYIVSTDFNGPKIARILFQYYARLTFEIIKHYSREVDIPMDLFRLSLINMKVLADQNIIKYGCDIYIYTYNLNRYEKQANLL